ncbi:MAG: molybdenum cofactor guanylyltransferase [Sphingopyxis solisilvae]|uniref:molybdenum cofactor guanylyltransferase n=1 Tax=Sphingopyxis solisilvae TaxID=1886788 RepID=UPI004035806E
MGAIIAGGRSLRFGSDKALAVIDGSTLFDHVYAGLSQQVGHMVVCGRDWPGVKSIPDFPGPGLGPLGGLCAALHHAKAHGYSHVISAPVDVMPFPADMIPRLVSSKPRVLADQFLIGAWTANLAEPLERHLHAGHRSLRSWIAVSGARHVESPINLRNINAPSDMLSAAARQSTFV